jgi:hypothetical protein
MTFDNSSDIPGIRGQVRESWRKDDLRGLLVAVRKEHPDKTRDQCWTIYLARAKPVDALVENGLRRCFDNDWRAKSPARAPVTEEEAEAFKWGLMSIVLLDLILPNGKKLRDCTGKECRAAGGWLIDVAERVGDDGMVGVLMAETELASIFARRQRRRKA